MPARDGTGALAGATAAEIATALGGAQRSGKWWRCRCPVHASQSAALALRDGDRDGSCALAMVARVDDAAGRLVAVHRTWLDRTSEGTWHRLDRASLGPTGGGAVRLAPAAETLLIGEGIETCLATMQATAQPAWAALSTSGLVALVLPPIVRTVIILADNDSNRAGEHAAETAAQRWLAEGRRVRIAMPPEPDTDMAGMLAGHAYARVTEAADAAA